MKKPPTSIVVTNHFFIHFLSCIVNSTCNAYASNNNVFCYQRFRRSKKEGFLNTEDSGVLNRIRWRPGNGN
jgi:hypothetical protein